MQPERWLRVEEIVGAALEEAPAARRALVATACGGDEALASEVWAILGAAESDPSFLETPAAIVAPLADARSEPVPERAGPWRIVRELGRGGMAVVYLAQRDDGTFEQQVALKVIRRGLDTDDLLDRFRRERRILASLHHPNIATVLDAGALPDGRPFLVMEYVEGEPVTAWCTAHGATREERLRIFLEICDAVRHAHARLIVHRDLKPGNILVTSAGRPTLLDFGIAKLLDPSSADDEGTATSAGLRAMTPQYASPEQVAGVPVTTASDVYSLGLILYELLAGRLPYSTRGLAPAEVDRVIRETTPAPPIGGTDLDTVVLKALAKAPDERYASATELAGDVERWLAGLPVSARPDSTWYRATKFLRRHRRAMALASLTLSLLLGFTVVTAVQAHRIRRQAEQVERQRVRGERVIAFMQELFQSADPFGGSGDTLSARAILERGTARIDSQLAGEPAARADLRMALARAWRGLAAYARADSLVVRALDELRALPGEGVGIAEALALRADLAADRGEADSAIARYEAALNAQRAVLGPTHPAVAATIASLGLAHFEAGDLPRAVALLREAMAMQRALAPRADSGLALTTNNLGLVLKNQGKLAEAESLYRESLALRSRVYGPEHPYTITTTMNLGRLLRDLGQYATAEEYLRRATDADRRTLGDRHPYVLGDESNLASVLHDLGRYREAEALLVRVLPVQREVLGADHVDVASTQMRLGRTYAALGRYADAERAHLEARRILVGRFAPRHLLILANESDLGALFRVSGRLLDARGLFDSVVPLLDSVVGPSHPLAISARVRQGRTLRQLGDSAAGTALLQGALRDAEATLPPGHPFTREIAALAAGQELPQPAGEE